MSTTHGHDEPAPVTDHGHERSWSANLEKPEHADDREVLLAQVVDAVEHTAAGHHVNLVTRGDHGRPGTYLFEELETSFGDAVEVEYVEQCGGGGHATRAHARG